MQSIGLSAATGGNALCSIHAAVLCGHPAILYAHSKAAVEPVANGLNPRWSKFQARTLSDDPSVEAAFAQASDSDVRMWAQS